MNLQCKISRFSFLIKRHLQKHRFLYMGEYDVKNYSNSDVLKYLKITTFFFAFFTIAAELKTTWNWTKNKFKVGLSLSKKNYFYLLQWKPFKNNEKRFLFHLKSSFHSQDIWIFVLTFWSCRGNGLIRKIRLISKFLTQQPG